MSASPIAVTYGFLFAAIVAEVIATTALARVEGFTRFWPSVITVIGYSAAFWFLSFPLRTLPTGVVYAVWCGAGIILITLVAWLLYGQKLDLPALCGLALIIAGVAVINIFSKALGH